MKRPEDLTLVELQNLLNDLHALMWAEGGCEICAHCEVVHREPYYKTTCNLEHGRGDCRPLWRGLAGEPETLAPNKPSF